MAERKILIPVQGNLTTDGAGVHLTRVLGNETVYSFDPFLMLDSFDSTNSDDYIRGFPWHPHRGIETITYLIEGSINHEDSLGNRGTIISGSSQWMTAGRGILHQEMPQKSPRMLGIQLWLNLPAAEKMCAPAYCDISSSVIPCIQEDFGSVRVISGSYGAVHGVKSAHIQASFFDIELKPQKELTVKTKPDETVFIFLIENSARVNGSMQSAKTAILFGEGDTIRVAATQNDYARFLFFSAKPLGEPIAWGGPIVMNTREELLQAFSDLEEGTFITR